MAVAQLEGSLVVGHADEGSEPNAATFIRRPDDLAVLTVVKYCFPIRLAGRRIRHGPKDPIVVVYRRHASRLYDDGVPTQG